jgi:hypothetical protein
MRQIGGVDRFIPRNSEKAIQEELDNIALRGKMHDVTKDFGHMDFGTRDKVRNHPHWPYTQHDSFVFMAKLEQMQQDSDCAGIIRGLHQFMDDELVQISGLTVLQTIIRYQVSCKNRGTITEFCDDIYNVACKSIRAYPTTLEVLDQACEVLYLTILNTIPSRTQQLYDDKILHILVMARNHLKFIPAAGFVILREPSDLDNLIKYCYDQMAILSQTHALDYPLPPNTDGLAFVGPNTVFIDSIPRLQIERNVGRISTGMDDFILFPLVQERGLAALVHIVSTNSWAGRTDWFDNSGEKPRAPAGNEEYIRRDFKLIFHNITQAIRKHPTCMPIMTEACKLLMLMYVMPNWFIELKKSRVMQVLIQARLNFGYQPQDDSTTHRVPQAMQQVILALQRREPVEFDALEAQCVSMARDVDVLTSSIPPLDYHRVRPHSVIDRGVQQHLWTNEKGKIHFG